MRKLPLGTTSSCITAKTAPFGRFTSIFIFLSFPTLLTPVLLDALVAFLQIPLTRIGFALSSKSDPANLALFGFLVSSLAKCFLHKAIFEYMVESTRAKKARLIASANMMNRRPILSSLKPVVRLIESIREMQSKERNHGRVAVDVQQDSNGSASDATNAASSVSKQGKFEAITEAPGERDTVADDVRTEVKAEERETMDKSFESLRTEARVT